MKPEHRSHVRTSLVAIGLVGLSLAGGRGFAEEKVACVVPERAVVTESDIRFRDVADCSGGPEALRERILNVLVGQAPTVGRVQRMDPDWFLVKIRQQGIEPDRIQWKASKNLAVTRESTRISKEALEGVFREFIVEKTAWVSDQVEVRNVQAKDTALVPKGKIRLEVEAPRGNRFLGKVTLPIRVYVDERLADRVWVSGEVLARAAVWVTGRPVRRGHVFTPADLHQLEVDLRSIPPGTVQGPREVIGKRARRSIKAQTPIQTGWLEKVPLVRRGDVVTLKAESETLLITTMGVLKTEGALGDLVEAVNLSSKKTVYGRVVDSQTVQVLF